MKNRTCRHCDTKFHACSSCGMTYDWEEEYCSTKCWNESQELRDIFASAKAVVKELSSAAKKTLLSLLDNMRSDEVEKALRTELSRITQDELVVYDPDFGDEKLCVCEHPYHRHFDSYDCMAPVGCKFCPCHDFREKPAIKKGIKLVKRQIPEPDPKCNTCAGTGWVEVFFDSYTAQTESDRCPACMKSKMKS